MAVTSSADFRNQIGEHLDIAQREPVVITNRGRRRAVVVSPDFYDRALQALEDAEDLHDVARARLEPGSISHDELLSELGLGNG